MLLYMDFENYLSFFDMVFIGILGKLLLVNMYKVFWSIQGCFFTPVSETDLSSSHETLCLVLLLYLNST